MKASAEIKPVIKSEPPGYIPYRQQRGSQKIRRSLHALGIMILLHRNIVLLLEHGSHAFIAQEELLLQLFRAERFGIVLFKP